VICTKLFRIRSYLPCFSVGPVLVQGRQAFSQTLGEGGQDKGNTFQGAIMIAKNEKDRFRSKITGNVYEVKKIADPMIVLEILNGKSQVLTELNNIALFYEKEPKKDDDQD